MERSKDKILLFILLPLTVLAGRWRKVKCGDALLSLQPLRL